MVVTLVPAGFKFFSETALSLMVVHAVLANFDGQFG